jgi:hypothetical protein
MKNWEIFKSIATVILAIAMFVVAIAALHIAETANQIAQNSYEIAYQMNLPVISAISKLHYDKTGHLSTEELIVNNDGFPLSDFSCSAYLIMDIYSAGNETYVPLDGYFGYPGNYTGNSKGLLVSMSEKGNYDLFSSIEYDFWQEASKDGYEYEPVIWQNIILEVSYKDYTLSYWHKYYYVYTSGSSEISENYIRGVLDCADANWELRKSKGLDCYISALNGTELWQWYKGQYLG